MGAAAAGRAAGTSGARAPGDLEREKEREREGGGEKDVESCRFRVTLTSSAKRTICKVI